MLPNSRSECDSGLEMYSTRLKRKLAGHSSGLLPNGAQNSSWIQPPSPLAAIENQIIIANTDSDNAKVVLTSAVGTRRHSCMPIAPNAAATQSAGMKSIEFISTTQTKTVSAAGAMNLLRSPWWKMPRTCSSTKSINNSTKACRLPGTPAVAPRTTHQRKPKPTMPSTTAVTTESTLTLQKPPPSATGLVRKLR